MFENYAEVLRLIDFAGGSVAGRKKLQKLVYLAQQKGWPFPESYRYYLYGPFSEQLANEIEEMKSFGFVIEGKQGPALCCSLTQAGRVLIGRHPNPVHMAEFKELVSELSQRDARNLELMATVLFLLKCGYSESDVPDAIGSLKPEQAYSDSEINEVLTYLSTRGFVEPTPTV